jgi:hypothetical protein
MSRWTRAACLAIVPAVAALLAAGCGGKSAAPGVASLGGTTTTAASADRGSTSTQSKAAGARSFSSCMRAHGVPNFPDPTSGGGITIGPSTGINPDAAQFQAAQRTCERLLPAGKAPTPAQRAELQAQALRFSACMRSHGVPSFPDPEFSAGGTRVKIGGGSGIDPNSPQFKRAQSFCKRYLPGGGKGLSTSAGKGTARVPAP